MEKTYQIIYNTESKDKSTKWKIICGSEEILVSDFYTTTKNTEKFTCTGFLTIRDNIGYITTIRKKSSIKRHLAKTITYRIFATAITIGTAFSLGVNLEISALLGFGEIVVKPVFYFFHERIWYKLRFNKK
jgi:uncharacterized membrane protein